MCNVAQRRDRRRSLGTHACQLHVMKPAKSVYLQAPAPPPPEVYRRNSAPNAGGGQVPSSALADW
ncbi:hypothetical protein KCP73_14250 [Salmonella enterica subsp. enterica]|nr:hypothetical protein KCP73_14250 [Salmonella enterica subsp. enterica]